MQIVDLTLSLILKIDSPFKFLLRKVFFANLILNRFKIRSSNFEHRNLDILRLKIGKIDFSEVNFSWGNYFMSRG